MLIPRPWLGLLFTTTVLMSPKCSVRSLMGSISGLGQAFSELLRMLFLRHALTTVLCLCRRISDSSWRHSLSRMSPLISLPANRIVNARPTGLVSSPKSCSCCILPASSLSRYLAASFAPYTSLFRDKMDFRRAAFSIWSCSFSALYWADSIMLELNFNSSDSLFTEKWKERRQFVGRLILVRGRGKRSAFVYS
jgi:hypothetical protein